MKSDEIFRNAPVSRAVLSMAVPTVISQLITVIYNMADTFFIGQLNQPAQVAAATVVMPVFMLLTGIANLYGMGGSSTISHLLGTKEYKQAVQCSSFCLLAGILTALLYGILLFVLKKPLLTLLGAAPTNYDYSVTYLFWTITIGAVPTVLNGELAHLVRAEGFSFAAGFGVALGGILNILLDPLFIFGLGMEIRGAAIATMLSNAAACVYFIFVLYQHRKTTVITCHFSGMKLAASLKKAVLRAGLPGLIMNAMGTVSNGVLNHLIAGYAEEAVAGIGIAKKVDLLAYAISQGMTQGVLPLIAYNHATRNFPRMKACIRVTFLYSLALAVVMAVLMYTLAQPLSRAFIQDNATIGYSTTFLQIICLACPFSALNFMMITVFQATGAALAPILLSLLRKGGLDVPLMFLFEYLGGVSAIAWATPAADGIVLILGLCFFIPYLRHLTK